MLLASRSCPNRLTSKQSGEQNVKEILNIRGHKNPDPHKEPAVLASKPSKLAYKHTDARRTKNLHAILNWRYRLLLRLWHLPGSPAMAPVNRRQTSIWDHFRFFRPT
jgi:hypothetical protein